MSKVKLPKEGIIGITYRCNARCQMCNTWKYPSKPEDEIKPSCLESLPRLRFCNITGGEPFIREDISEFLKVLSGKSKRVVISTNGYFTDKIIKLAKDYPKVGIRVSIEGMAKTNDELRGLENCFEHGIRTLKELDSLGRRDIGFGITLSDGNISDLMKLYQLSTEMNFEFATACVHNTYYFHKFDNRISRLDDFRREFKELITDLLKGGRIKNWYRAYFNYGLLNYAFGNKRLLPCGAGRDLFFIDPYGEVMACNGMDMSMGNIKKKAFGEIWNSEEAGNVRKAVKGCAKNCLMIGTAGPAMKKNLIIPTLWVIKNKIRLIMGKEIEICLKR